MLFMFHQYKKTIEEGDHVIVHLSASLMHPVQVTAGKIYNNKFGSFTHDSMIGLKYGSKLSATTGRGFVHLLHPTPALWTQVVPHRTQILYLPDISFISAYLDLKPGKIMIESGTGSGSFSHSIARTISPTGHLYTFEYHEKRVETAKAEFEAHKLNDVVTIQHRDVIADGFGMDNVADAVFLDLPAPWDAVAAAKKALRRDTIGRVCSFSPCIEQVQKTALALNEHGFCDIRMYECLAKDYEIRRLPAPDIDVAISGVKAKFKLDKKSHKKRKLESQENNNGETPVEDEETTTLLSKPVDTVRGHTSYLTFAILAPETNDMEVCQDTED